MWLDQYIFIEIFQSFVVQKSIREIYLSLILICLYNGYTLKQEMVPNAQIWALRVLEN